MSNDLNESMTQVGLAMSTVLEAANRVQLDSAEIAQGNGDLSARTEKQAANLEQTASSMEQITSLVKESAERSRDTRSTAEDLSHRAESGGEVVARAIDAMTQINSASREIADIIGVIDEIAFQTNLLALNAAVEAARAGESGRGFAVVAGEVRNLAQRSAKAAKEIKDLIRDSVSKVEDGTQLVNASGETLSELVVSIRDVASRVADINRAADEQSAGIEQVNKAVAEMDEMTQQNAALVEQATASSESMANQAQQMVKAVSFFTLDVAASGAVVPQNSERVRARVETTVAKASEEWSEF